MVLAHLTIMRIECRHNVIRRLLSSWTSTWQQDLPYIASQFVLVRQRNIECRHPELQKVEGQNAEDGDNAEPNDPKKRGCSHAGASRAFASETLASEEAKAITNLRERMDDAHALYRRIKLEIGPEYVRFQAKGRAGVLRGRLSGGVGSSFRDNRRLRAASANVQAPSLAAAFGARSLPGLRSLLRIRVFLWLPGLLSIPRQDGRRLPLPCRERWSKFIGTGNGAPMSSSEPHMVLRCGIHIRVRMCSRSASSVRVMIGPNCTYRRCSLAFPRWPPKS